LDGRASGLPGFWATVRTDTAVERHAGITVMAINMSAPGVLVRPLRELTGDAFFNEVFLDEVFVPDADVIGAVNDGRRVARGTLASERHSIGGNPVTLQAEALLDLLDRHPGSDAGVPAELGVLLLGASRSQAARRKSCGPRLRNVCWVYPVRSGTTSTGM
jgi:hypothetical protein